MNLSRPAHSAIRYYHFIKSESSFVCFADLFRFEN